MSDRYDVLIVRTATRQVSSIAGQSLPMEADGRPSAASLFVELCPGVRNAFNLAIVPAGQFAPGDTLPEDVETHRPQRQRKARPAKLEGESYTGAQRERLADSRCLRCGDPHLFGTGILCERCTMKNREAVARANSPI